MQHTALPPMEESVSALFNRHSVPSESSEDSEQESCHDWEEWHVSRAVRQDFPATNNVLAGMYTEIDEDKFSQMAQGTADAPLPTEIGTSLAYSHAQDSVDDDIETTLPVSVDLMMYPRSVASTVDDGEEASVPSRRVSEIFSPRVMASPRVPVSPRVLSNHQSPRNRALDSPSIPRSPIVHASPAIVTVSGSWEASFARDHGLCELSPFTVDEVIEPLMHLDSESEEQSRNDLPQDPSIMKFEELRCADSARQEAKTPVLQSDRISGKVGGAPSNSRNGSGREGVCESGASSNDEEILPAQIINELRPAVITDESALGITIDSILERYGDLDIKSVSFLATPTTEQTSPAPIVQRNHEQERTAWNIEKKVLLGQLRETKAELSDLQTEHRMLQWVRDTLQYEVYTLQGDLSRAHSLQDELAHAHTRHTHVAFRDAERSLLRLPAAPKGRVAAQACIRVHSKMGIRLCFSLWGCYGRCAGHKRALALQLLRFGGKRSQRAAMAGSFEQWRSMHTVMTGRARVALQLLARKQRTALSSSMAAWRGTAAEERRHRLVMMRVLLRWSSQQAAVVLRAWVLRVQATQSRAAVEQRAAQTRVSRLAASNFLGWKAFVQYKAGIAAQAVRLLRKVRARCREEALAVWHQEACSSVSAEELAMALARIQRLRTGRFFGGWRAAGRGARRLLTIGRRVRECGLIPLSLDSKIRVADLYAQAVPRAPAAWQTVTDVTSPQQPAGRLRSVVGGWRFVTHLNGKRSTAVARLQFLREGACLVSGFYHWAGLVGDFVRVSAAARMAYAMHVQLVLRGTCVRWSEACEKRSRPGPQRLHRTPPHPDESDMPAGQHRVQAGSDPPDAPPTPLPSSSSDLRPSPIPHTPRRAQPCPPSPTDEDDSEPGPPMSRSRDLSPGPRDHTSQAGSVPLLHGPMDGAATVAWASVGGSGGELTERGRALTGLMRRRLRGLFGRWEAAAEKGRERARKATELRKKQLRKVRQRPGTQT